MGSATLLNAGRSRRRIPDGRRLLGRPFERRASSLAGERPGASVAHAHPIRRRRRHTSAGGTSRNVRTSRRRCGMCLLQRLFLGELSEIRGDVVLHVIPVQESLESVEEARRRNQVPSPDPGVNGFHVSPRRHVHERLAPVTVDLPSECDAQPPLRDLGSCKACREHTPQAARMLRFGIRMLHSNDHAASFRRRAANARKACVRGPVRRPVARSHVAISYWIEKRSRRHSQAQLVNRRAARPASTPAPRSNLHAPA